MKHEKLTEMFRMARRRPGLYFSPTDRHCQVFAMLFGYDLAKGNWGKDADKGTHSYVLKKIAHKRKTGNCYPSERFVDFDTFLGDVIEVLEELNSSDDAAYLPNEQSN